MDRYLEQFLNTTLDAAFVTDGKGIILHCNSVASQMFGFSREELLGENIKILTPAGIREHHDSFLKNFSPSKGVSHVLGASKLLEAQHANGRLFPVEVGISHFEDNGECFFIGLIRDQSERVAHLEKITYLATRDPLTGLSNRTHFLERTQQLNEHVIAVMEIVGFRNLNFHLGPKKADLLLTHVAERLKEHACHRSVLARYSGNKFAICYPTFQTPQALGRKIDKVFLTPFEIDCQLFELKARTGIASQLDDKDTNTELLDKAEQALIQARNLPASSFAIFDAECVAREKRHSEIAKAIPHSLEKGEFSLCFQPKIRQSDRKIVGAETLIRWNDGPFGFVSPAEFIPIAEQNGLIATIDGWVFKETVKYLSELTAKGHKDLELAVNLSALNLHDPALCKKIANVFQQHKLPPQRIQLELTETALSDNFAQTVNTLKELNALGCPIAVDDFGTGYSSLSYLTQLPLNYLKVDQSFVAQIGTDPKADTVVRSLISMAKGLGLKTIVEGVETSEQIDFLTNQDADIFQGYFFSKPLPKEEFERFLTEFGA